MSSNSVGRNVNPTRKRRRPALSCAQCRQRKIKCDRNHPCGHCAASKSTECIYEGSHLIRNETTISDQQRFADGFLPTPESTHTVPSAHEVETFKQSQIIDDAASKEPSTRSAIISSLGLKTLPSTVENLNNNGEMVVTVNSAQFLAAHQSETRSFGRSHLIATCVQFEKICCYYKKCTWQTPTKPTSTNQAQLNDLLHKCQYLAKAVKSGRQPQWVAGPDSDHSIPPRQVVDRLVQLYFRMFESCYRVFHTITFEREYAQYWQNPQEPSLSFVMKLLLIMALGSTFYEHSGHEPSPRSMAAQWIHSAQSWVSLSFQKDRQSMEGIQIQCLLILARESTSIGCDFVWTSVGTLLRTAMQMGYNRDPKHFPKINTLHAEIRRRLWATIMELAVQTSLTAGMPPIISMHDFDTASPANINDAELHESTPSTPIPPSTGSSTMTSVQIALLRSLPIRLEICSTLNHFRNDPSYDMILKLSTEMMTTNAEAASLIEYRTTDHEDWHVTRFHRNLLKFLTQRFLVALHGPYAFKARNDPRYYFSRQSCIESAFDILSFEQDASFDCLMLLGGGIFREIPTHAAASLGLEIVMQLEDEKESVVTSTSRSRHLLRAPLLKLVEQWNRFLCRRIEAGENNVKGYAFLSAILGQIDALQQGLPPEDGIFKAAVKSLEECYDVLSTRIVTDMDNPLHMDGNGQSSLEQLQQQSLASMGEPNEDFSNEFSQFADFDFGMLGSWLTSEWKT